MGQFQLLSDISLCKMFHAEHLLASAPVAGESSESGPLPMILFILFGGITAGAGFSVAIAKNIVRAAVGLLFALAGMSGLYLLLNAEFIAAVQLVVYVGGTLILIVFGVMLTSKSPRTTYAPKRGEVIWACIVTLLVGAPVMAILVSTFNKIAPPEIAATLPATAIAATSPATSGDSRAAIGMLGQQYPMQSMGRALIDPAGFLVPFELVSVLLLAVMIGAAYLAKGRRAKSQPGGAA
jgi:NADH-quinone oxidoreductase subunit J